MDVRPTQFFGDNTQYAETPSAYPISNSVLGASKKISHLAFSSIRPDDTFISVTKPSNVEYTVSHGSLALGKPVVSPDENWMVFSSQHEGTTCLYIKNLSTRNAPVTKLTDGTAFEDAAVYSADGKHIYFTALREGGLNICRAIFTPGSAIKMQEAEFLTRGNGYHYSPSISPCGKFLAFCRERDRAGAYQSAAPSENYLAGGIYLLELEKQGDPLPLTLGKDSLGQPIWEGTPVFSPDGKALFFYRQSEADEEGKRNTAIYKIDLESKELARISPEKGDALYPRLSGADRFFFTFRGQDRGKWMAASTNFDGFDFRLEYSDGEKNHWDASRSGSTIVHCYSEPETAKAFPLETPPSSRTNMGQGSFLIQSFEKSLDEGHTLSVRVYRGYSPLVDMKTGKVFATHEFDSIVSSDLEGRQIKQIYHATPVFGLSKGKNSPWLFTSAGVPFDESKPCDILKVHTETGETVNITINRKGERSVWPSVTGDGQTVVFQRRTSKGPRIMITDGEGVSEAPLHESGKSQMMPAISSSGKLVSFTEIKRTKESLKARLKLVTIDPASKAVIKVETLLKDSHVYFHSTFSAEEDWMAVSSNRGGLLDEKPRASLFFNPQPYGEIFMIRLSDKKVVRITQDAFENSLPSLS